MWEISPRVNSPKNDDPLLWEPIHLEATQRTNDVLELSRQQAHAGREVETEAVALMTWL
jgi:hypothetical protein